ncbi:restriction endonuclease subunit S [Candidatus Poribacteria bacterium]|nr:restriction endonuclease subunit S [Candidatus Poribacteria bacterium]
MNIAKTDLQRFSGRWETKRLGDIAHIKTGSKNNEDKDENGQYPLFVRSAIAEQINSYCYDGEAILVPGEGGIGSIFHYINGRFDCHQRVYMINKFSDDVCGKLVYYSMVLQFGSHAMQNTVKATVDSLRLPTFKNFSFSLPQDIGEQRAIAKVLSDVDGLLNALEGLIAKKQAIKQATMQQLLTGRTRLPGFSGKWERKRLGEIGTLTKGRGIKRDDVSSEGLPCVRYGELYTRYQDYILKVRSRIPPNIAATALPIKKGDLLFAGSGETAEEIGRCAAYLGEEPAYAGGDVIVLIPSGHNSIYLGHLMNSSIVSAQKARMGQGDAVVHIYINNLAQVQIELPSITEQNAIASVLSDMDSEIAALEQRRDKTRAIKQGMMQQLLTGRVRLSESRICTDDTDYAD